MVADMEFLLLGPLVVRQAGTEIPVRRGKERQVLARLLLDAGRLVPVEDLVATLWGSAPPATARQSLQNHVMRLRNMLGDGQRARIGTQPRGYLIRAEPSELDIARFEAAVAEARAAVRAERWPAAAPAARAALALWRGDPLAGVDSELLAAREVPRLHELRLQAQEMALDADLHLGHAPDVIAELRRLVAGHPLRERLHQLLMLALFRDGRQGEALLAYQDARRVLADEVGADPGPELRGTYQHVLAGADDREPSSPPVPHQLPVPVTPFAGRTGELARLNELLGPSRAGAVVISAIGGTAGVGKTALAVHWAHQAAPGFPDGQLYVDLRGYDPGQPVPAADALAGFLRALGAAGEDIPAGLAERSARYRSLLAGRRLLVVLDNAGSVEQVRPLLPGTVGCVTVVTSRDALAGLVARDGAARLDVDPLTPADAQNLLHDLIGARVGAHPTASATLARQCAHLPLALRLAAELAVARPTVPVADLVVELSDHQDRLDLLAAGGDQRSAVRAVFSWSYRYLDAAAARAFRLIGLHPGPDLDVHAAAALVGGPVRDTRQVLGQLTRAYLVRSETRDNQERFSLHDLLRAYAAELAGRQDGPDGQRATWTRLLNHYLGSAAAAMDALFPSEQHRRPRVARPDPAPPQLAAPAARDWLDAERANLVAVTIFAAEHGWLTHAIRLAATLSRYLDVGGFYPEAINIHRRAQAAAHDLGDLAAEAEALTSLSVASWRRGQAAEATGYQTQALTLCRRAGDQASEARALTNLANIDLGYGCHEQAADRYRQVVAMCQQNADRGGEARALCNLGVAELEQGRYDQAREYLQRSLDRCQEIGDPVGQAYALTNLGDADQRQDRHQLAVSQYQRAIALFRATGNRTGEGYVLTSLGDVQQRQGRYQQAIGQHRQALLLFRDTGDRTGEAQARNGIGAGLAGIGQLAEARVQHAIALDLADQTGNHREQARAHDGLGCAFDADGQGAEAGRHWSAALAAYTSLGAPEATRVRARLAHARPEYARPGDSGAAHHAQRQAAPE